MLLEAMLPKQRILELYLNVIEWGNGVFGAEAAAQRYFGVGAAQLSPPSRRRGSPRWRPIRASTSATRIAPGLNRKIATSSRGCRRRRCPDGPSRLPTGVNDMGASAGGKGGRGRRIRLECPQSDTPTPAA